MSKKPIYKVIFHNQGKIYEMYARSVQQGAIFGFIEMEQLVFGCKNSLVVDPTEENLKSEFSHVTRTCIPMHSVIRIDQMDKQGVARIMEYDDKGQNVMPFPLYTKGGE